MQSIKDGHSLEQLILLRFGGLLKILMMEATILRVQPSPKMPMAMPVVVLLSSGTIELHIRILKWSINSIRLR